MEELEELQLQELEECGYYTDNIESDKIVTFLVLSFQMELLRKVNEHDITPISFIDFGKKVRVGMGLEYNAFGVSTISHKIYELIPEYWMGHKVYRFLVNELHYDP